MSDVHLDPAENLIIEMMVVVQNAGKLSFKPFFSGVSQLRDVV